MEKQETEKWPLICPFCNKEIKDEIGAILIEGRYKAHRGCVARNQGHPLALIGRWRGLR